MEFPTMAFKGSLAVSLVALCAISCVQGFTVPTSPALNAARRLGCIGTASASSSSVGARSMGISVLGSRRVAMQLRGPSMRLSDNAMQLGDKSTGGASVLDRPSVVTAPTPDDVAQVDPKKPYHVLLFNVTFPVPYSSSATSLAVLVMNLFVRQVILPVPALHEPFPDGCQPEVASSARDKLPSMHPPPFLSSAPNDFRKPCPSHHRHRPAKNTRLPAEDACRVAEAPACSSTHQHSNPLPMPFLMLSSARPSADPSITKRAGPHEHA